MSTGFNDKLIVKFPLLTSLNPVVWFVCKKVAGKGESSTTATIEAPKRNDAIVYPNPTTGNLFITNHLGKFELYNTLGMKVLIPESELNRAQMMLDFRNFAKGIYYINFLESSQTIKISIL